MGKVILIRPKFTKTLQPNPPIGLGYLASYLEKKHHKVFLIDCWVLDITNKEIFEIIKKINPDIVGLTALSSHYEEMRELCNFISYKRAENKNLLNFLLVIGGVHATALPELSIVQCKADLAVLGEGEVTLLELIDSIENHKNPFEIDGIAYFENGNFKRNKPRDLIENLDNIPFPAWHLMPIKNYPHDPHGHDYIRKPFAPILTTRGCPFSCTYCASTNFWGKRIRYRNPKNVVDEMEFLIEAYNIREFHIWDDNITLSKKHIKGICREIIQRKLDVTLRCPNGLRIDSLDLEILTWMKRAGFYLIVLAVESASQRVLDRAKKKLNLQKVPKIIKLANELGFITKGFFILGLPGETISSALKTIKYPRENRFNFATFFIASPLPGSELFNIWKKNNETSQITWHNIQLDTGEYSLSDLDIITLKKLRNRGILSFYLSPYFLYTILKYPKVIYNWFKNVFIFIIRRFFERNFKKIRS